MPGPLQYFLLLPLLFVLSTSYSQNIESIGADKPIKISGGLSANQIFYSSSANSSRNPYNYYLGGSIALDIYGLQLPFSFTYSNQKSNFRQPFNQFSLHPTYKWVTGHFGYVSTSYSPYTVNGHVFRGGTIDLSPGDKWQIGVMVGQLQKAIDDTSDSVDNNSAYQRIGYGLRMRYGTNSDYVQFVLFKSSDDTGSLPDVAYEFIQPEENLAVSISFSKMVLKKLLIQAEYSGSAVSRDILAAASTTKSHPLSYLTWIFTPRNSSEYYNAYNTQLTYQAKSFTIGMRYEQVGADYRTHGAYYFNNNFYNLTANSNISLAAGRVNVAVNLGFQQDDPQNIKLN